MFCPECGTNVSEGASFCPQCGKCLSATNMVATAGNAAPDQFGSKIPSQMGGFSAFSYIDALKNNPVLFSRVIVGAQLVLCLLSLLPFFSLDLILFSSECSILMLFPTLSEFSEYLGSSSTGIALYAWAFVISALWLGAAVMTVFDTLALVKGGKCRGLAALLYLVLGLLALVSVFGVNAYVSGSISYTFFSVTVWVWLLVVISALAVALHVYRVGPANYKDYLFR